jgi:hypothetical protein
MPVTETFPELLDLPAAMVPEIVMLKLDNVTKTYSKGVKALDFVAALKRNTDRVNHALIDDLLLSGDSKRLLREDDLAAANGVD